MFVLHGGLNALINKMKQDVSKLVRNIILFNGYNTGSLILCRTNGQSMKCPVYYLKTVDFCQ